jgi:hypothetical protein
MKKKKNFDKNQRAIQSQYKAGALTVDLDEEGYHRH